MNGFLIDDGPHGVTMGHPYLQRVARRELLEIKLRARFPAISRRLARTLAHGFEPRGLPALLAASDAEVLAVVGVGPDRLAEWRALQPREAH